jgi:hypothetical protein
MSSRRPQVHTTVPPTASFSAAPGAHWVRHVDLGQLGKVRELAGARFDQHHQQTVHVGKDVATLVDAGAGRDGQPGSRPHGADRCGDRLDIVGALIREGDTGDAGTTDDLKSTHCSFGNFGKQVNIETSGSFLGQPSDQIQAHTHVGV